MAQILECGDGGTSSPLYGPETRFRKASGFVTRSITGETIIVPIRGGVGDLDSIYTLNEVGSRIWSLLEEPRAFQEIVEAIGREYQAAPEEVSRDAQGFLEALQAGGLARATGAGED
jgi:hypothetical protein